MDTVCYKRMEEDKYTSATDVIMTREESQHLSGMTIMTYRRNKSLVLTKRNNTLKDVKHTIAGSSDGSIASPASLLFALTANKKVSATWDYIENEAPCRLGLYRTNVIYQLIGNNIVAVGDKISVTEIVGNNALIVCNELIVDSIDVAYSLAIVANKVTITGKVNAGGMMIVCDSLAYSAKEHTGGRYFIVTPDMAYSDPITNMCFNKGILSMEMMIGDEAMTIVKGILAYNYTNTINMPSPMSWAPILVANDAIDNRVIKSPSDKQRMKALQRNTSPPDVIEETAQDIIADPTCLTMDTDMFMNDIQRMNNKNLMALVDRRYPEDISKGMNKRELLAVLKATHAHRPFLIAEMEFGNTSDIEEATEIDDSVASNITYVDATKSSPSADSVA